MSVGLIGVLLIALSGVMLGVALPRSPERGEAVRFLRDRNGLQMTYVVAMTCLFLAGIVTIAFGIGR